MRRDATSKQGTNRQNEQVERREYERENDQNTMATSTDQQKTFNAIWGILERLRAGVHANDIEIHIISILFYRFVSEKLATYINKGEEEGFDYASLTDEQAEQARTGIADELGYFILPSDLFCNIYKKKNDPDFNLTVSGAYRRFDESCRGASRSEKNFEDLLNDIDFSTPKLGPDIFEVFNNLDIDYTDADNDIFGDIYEFLMHKFASNGGKSGGEFYTPQEVSKLLTKLMIKEHPGKIRKVYDPACGSGSLLLQFRKQLRPTDPTDQIEYCGQEINVTTYNIARMNMILHGVEYTHFDIELGDTLTDPKHRDEQFDAVVSNPPYSISWEGDSNPTLINDERFAPAGVLAPKSKADLAFTMHILYSLADDGTAAIVEFPGVLYRGGAEQKIRKYLVDHNYIAAIIQLPENMFYGVSIATCILILNKGKADDEYVHEGNKNKLSDADIDFITKTVADRKDITHVSKIVDKETIAGEEYNLAVSTYVEKKDDRPDIDIDDLNARLADTVASENKLRADIDAIIDEFVKEWEAQK